MSSKNLAGTICQLRPYLSFSQPQTISWPPWDRLLEVVVHFGLVRAGHHDRDGLVEGELRAAVQAENFCPFSSNSTSITERAGPVPASV